MIASNSNTSFRLLNDDLPKILKAIKKNHPGTAWLRRRQDMIYRKIKDEISRNTKNNKVSTSQSQVRTPMPKSPRRNIIKTNKVSTLNLIGRLVPI